MRGAKSSPLRPGHTLQGCLGNVGTMSAYHSGMEACGAGGLSMDLACFRSTFTGLAALFTFFGCILKLVWLVKAESDDDPRTRSFKIIFSLAVAETAMLSYKWLYWGPVEIHFVVLYLQVIQFLVLCLFYAKLAFKVHQATGHRIKQVTWPVTAAIILYFSIVLIVAIFNKKSNAIECKDGVWMMFSASQLILAIVFVCAGVVLTRAMGRFPTSEGGATEMAWKKISLWLLIGSYMTTAVMGFSFDIAFYTLTDDKTTKCDEVFGSDSSTGYTLFKLGDRLCQLLPLWVMLGVLKCKIKVNVVTDISEHQGLPDGNQPQVSVFKPQTSAQSLESWGELALADPTDDFAVNQSGGSSFKENSPLLGSTPGAR